MNAISTGLQCANRIREREASVIVPMPVQPHLTGHSHAVNHGLCELDQRTDTIRSRMAHRVTQTQSVRPLVDGVLEEGFQSLRSTSHGVFGHKRDG